MLVENRIHILTVAERSYQIRVSSTSNILPPQSAAPLAALNDINAFTLSYNFNHARFVGFSPS